MENTAIMDSELTDMLRAGVHVGHRKSKTHASMRPYVFGVRNTVSLIDLTQTKECLERVSAFVSELSRRGGMILFVGTRPAGRTAVRECVARIGMPYFLERWIGGTLTNFKEVIKRVAYLEALEREQTQGGFEKYSKKERARKEEEITRLKKHFDGLRLLKRLPDAVFVVDSIEDATAVREARKSRIPVIALVDTNADVSVIDYPIPANDDALPAVRYMVGKIADAIEAGMKNRGVPAPLETNEPTTA